MAKDNEPARRQRTSESWHRQHERDQSGGKGRPTGSRPPTEQEMTDGDDPADHPPRHPGEGDYA